MLLLKKHHNVIEAPVAPFIQRDPPRFQWAGKFNNVDTDMVLRDTETKTQYYDDAVLAVARDQNQRRYGFRSWYGPQIKNFRPPLIDPELDLQPLSRLPRPRTQARTNPVMPYRTQNGHDPDVGAYIDPRQLNGSVRTNPNVRFETPLDYEICPDLELNRPSVEGFSGQRGPDQDLRFDYDVQLENSRPTTSVTAVETMPVNQMYTPVSDIELSTNHPTTSVTAISTIPVNEMYTPVNDIELSYSQPTTSVTAIGTTPVFMPADTYDNIELYSSQPTTSVTATSTMPVNQMYVQDPDDYNLTSKIAAQGHSIKVSPVMSADNQRYENVHLREKINPGGYHTIGNMPGSLQHQTPTLRTNRKPQVSSYGF